MERYARAPVLEGFAGDPAAGWPSAGGETGLEEPMWQLALAGGSYPERPGEPDCIYYLRTGFCGYGTRCRFNHPPDRIMALEAGRYGEGEYPERVDQPVCKFYLRTGTCKFGASCKYHHPRQGGGSISPVLLNYFGYPLRPGEKECAYYVRTGECKFGVSCKFHHPQPEEIQAPTPVQAPAGALVPAQAPTAIYPPVPSPSAPPPQQFNLLASNWPVVRPPTISGPFVPGHYGHVVIPPGMVSVPGWNPYQGSPLSPITSPSSQTAGGATPFYGITRLSPSAPAYTGSYASIPSASGPSDSIEKEQPLPERPGQPECQYYMKTGECKFGSSCRYHHPPEWSAPRSDCAFSPLGLPLRPGAVPCAYYLQHGMCKFGRSCKFDHPMETLSYTPSISSLADMPITPYPMGSYISILAPSSSSSDLRHEHFLGSGRDFLTRVSSSGGTSIISPSGSIVSKSQQIPRSSAEQTAPISSSHNGEAPPPC